MFPRVLLNIACAGWRMYPHIFLHRLQKSDSFFKEINLVLFSNDNLISWQCKAWKKSSTNKHELIIPYCKRQRRREKQHALPHDTR